MSGITPEFSNPGILSRAISTTKAGDMSGLHFLYARYADSVQGCVESFGRDRAEAEETTQALFASLPAKLQRYEQREIPFSAWILRVARDTALDSPRLVGDQLGG